MFTATRLQVATYLLGVCPFSIAFLVFVNSSVSFVVTDLIKLHHGTGNAVGTLGFADELLALAACPAWGLLSDRLGVKLVCTLGYAIIGLALVLTVQAKNVYPQLLLARLLFSLGGSAASTMVTAILPSMTAEGPGTRTTTRSGGLPDGIAESQTPGPNGVVDANGFGSTHAVSPSISSELTITPARLRSQSPSEPVKKTSPRPSSSQLAGFVGMFTGCGALIALGIFLPLPAHFQDSGISPGQALADSYYVVGGIAIALSIFCFFGLRGLKGEDNKGLKRIAGNSKTEEPSNTRFSALLRYWTQFHSALLLGFRQKDIGLGYLGGFVARASSVGISLFVPLLVNAYFRSSGLCDGDPSDGPDQGLGDLKRHCPKAYILAAELTGVAELVALISAPVFGYLSDKAGRFNFPLLFAAGAGIVGYVTLALLPSPRPSGEDGSPVVFVAMCLIGISQIGAIVCSLGILSDGILRTKGEKEEDGKSPPSQNRAPLGAAPPVIDTTDDNSTPANESTNLLPSQTTSISTNNNTTNMAHLKGSIAGIYSLYGGAGILLLTKLGGVLFDQLSPGAPFYILAIFNGILLVAGVVCGGFG